MYRESNKKSIDLYKTISIILTVIFGLSTFYFAKKNYDLKIKESKVIEFEMENDSLRITNKKLESEIKVWKNKVESKTKLE